MLKVGSDSLFMDKGCIFQKLDRIYNKYVVFKYNENFSANHSQAWVNSAVYSGYHGLHGDCWHLCHQIRQVVWHSSQCVTRWWVRIVSRLKQTCTTTGASRKWVMTVTNVMILNYAVGLDVARDGTQCNTQDVWPCKLPIDSLPLQILAMSPDLMEDLRKQPRRCFP